MSSHDDIILNEYISYLNENTSSTFHPENINELYISYLNEAEEETDTAQKAHALGLTAAGWGYWQDASGEKVARTVKGQLVKLTDQEKEKLKKGQEKRKAKQDSGFSMYRDEPNTPEEHDKLYYNPKWYNNKGANYHLNFNKVLDVLRSDAEYDKYSPNGKHHLMEDWEDGSKFCRFISRIMDSKVHYYRLNDEALNSYKDTEIESYKGHSVTYGTFDSNSKVIHLSPEATQYVQSLISYLSETPKEEVNKMIKRAYFKPEYDENGQEKQDVKEFKRKIAALKTVIHENVHAKDHFLGYKENDSVRDYQLEFNVTHGEALSYSRFIMEGLTEYKAIELTKRMLTDRTDFYMRNTYEREVEAIRMLDIREKGIANKIWEADSLKEKVAIIRESSEQIIDKHLDSMLRFEKITKEEFVGFNNMLKNWDMFDLWRNEKLHHIDSLLFQYSMGYKKPNVQNTLLNRLEIVLNTDDATIIAFATSNSGNYLDSIEKYKAEKEADEKNGNITIGSR